MAASGDQIRLGIPQGDAAATIVAGKMIERVPMLSQNSMVIFRGYKLSHVLMKDHSTGNYPKWESLPEDAEKCIFPISKEQLKSTRCRGGHTTWHMSQDRRSFVGNIIKPTAVFKEGG